MTRTSNKAYAEDGTPRYLRCYDSGPDGPMDRYTVVFTRTRGGTQHFLGMSEHPFHPLGVGQHGETPSYKPIDKPSYAHLGKKVSFGSLPPDVKRCVMQDYTAWWGPPEGGYVELLKGSLANQVSLLKEGVKSST